MCFKKAPAILAVFLLTVLSACVLFSCGEQRQDPPDQPETSLASSGQTEDPAQQTSESSEPAVQPPVSEDLSEPDAPSDEPHSDAPHEHVFVEEVIPPDCLNAGKVIERCECGETREREGEKALGHDFAETRNEPGCLEDGELIRKCRRCGLTETKVLKALGHDYVNRKGAWSSTPTGFSTALHADCSRCGAKGICLYEFDADAAIAFSNADPEPDLPGEGGKVTGTKVASGVKMKAQANKDYTFLGWSDGETETEREYGGTEPVYALFGYMTNKMAVMDVRTEGGEMITHRDYYLRCRVTMADCDEKFAFRDVEAGIRVRGNASSNYGDPEYAKTHKVHYRIKFDKKQGMLGLNDGAECKSWVLLRGDTNFLRETLSFKLFDDIVQGKYYSSDYTFVQLYVNGQYYGAYVLCEQTQIQKNRVAIPELKEGETELRTGYLLEIDNYPSGEPYVFATSFGGKTLTDMYGVSKAIHAQNYSVKYDSLTGTQLNFVKRFVNNAYEVVYRAIFQNSFYTLDGNNNLVKDNLSKTAEECISKVIDLDAAVAMYITREVAAERDGGVGSSFLYVDFQSEQPKLTFCAPWDFSWAYATTNGFAIDHFWVSAFQPPEFAYAGDRSFTWFITLYNAEFFREKVKETWRDMHARKVQDGILEEIDRVVNTYKKEFGWNQKRWNSGSQASSAKALYNFLKARMEWLDTQWN